MQCDQANFLSLSLSEEQTFDFACAQTRRVSLFVLLYMFWTDEAHVVAENLKLLGGAQQLRKA